MSLTNTIISTKCISKDIYNELTNSELYYLTIDYINKILYDTIKDRIKKTYLITSGKDKDIRVVITYNNHEYLLITEKPYKTSQESLYDLMNNANSLCKDNCYLKEEVLDNYTKNINFSSEIDDSIEYEKIQYHLIPTIYDVINQHKNMGLLNIIYNRYKLHKLSIEMNIKNNDNLETDAIKIKII